MCGVPSHVPTLDDVPYRPPRMASGEWSPMQDQNLPTTPQTLSATAVTTAPLSTTKADPNWKPQPCGLSRDELRRIVAEILG